MVDPPSLDRYDGVAALASAALIAFGYLVYPTHLVKVAVWLMVFTITFCWIGYFLWKWTYDVEM